MPTVSLSKALAEQAVKTLEECLRAGYTLGGVPGFNPRLWRYFNKGFYDRRWSHSGDVVLPERARHG